MKASFAGLGHLYPTPSPRCCSPPGEFAIADLTYLTAGSDDGGKGWHVSTVSITPPNGANTQTIPWADSLDLVKQDAATHPGTYVGPAHAGK